MNLKNNHKGNSFIISIFIIAIVITIFILVVAIYFGIMNSTIYNIKLDMYSVNKSAILAVNKGITSRKGFSYDIKDYRKYFENQLKTTYNLNDNLENKDGLVQKIEIIEYSILEKGKKDKVTNKKCDGNVIHTHIRVKLKPLILAELIEDSLNFDIHEDVTLNKLIM